MDCDLRRQQVGSIVASSCLTLNRLTSHLVVFGLTEPRLHDHTLRIGCDDHSLLIGNLDFVLALLLLDFFGKPFFHEAISVSVLRGALQYTHFRTARSREPAISIVHVISILTYFCPLEGQPWIDIAGIPPFQPSAS